MSEILSAVIILTINRREVEERVIKASYIPDVTSRQMPQSHDQDTGIEFSNAPFRLMYITARVRTSVNQFIVDDLSIKSEGLN